MDKLTEALLKGLKRQEVKIPGMRNPYPVTNPDAETLGFFKQNPHISGMAVGAGLNGTPKDAPRTVVVNPYSKLPENNKNLLIENERMRHFMDENDLDPEFEPTPEQTKFFEGEEYGKPENKKYLKQTIISRILTGDPSAGKITIEQQLEADRVYDMFHSTFPK